MERALDATVQLALDHGLFQGIGVQPQYLQGKSDDQSVKEDLARAGLATDHAIRYGRSALCSKGPVMKGVIDELNEINSPYASGEADDGGSGLDLLDCEATEDQLAELRSQRARLLELNPEWTEES